MGVRRLAVLLLVPLAGCGGGEREHVFADGGFAVVLPGAPRAVTDPDLPEGTHQLRLDQRSGTYTVAWQDLPAGADNDPDERLDRACNGALRALGASQLSRTPIRLDGRAPGRELVAGWEGRDARVRARLYLAGGRLYQLAVTGPPAWVDSPEADRFLGSFRLTGEEG